MRWPFSLSAQPEPQEEPAQDHLIVQKLSKLTRGWGSEYGIRSITLGRFKVIDVGGCGWNSYLIKADEVYIFRGQDYCFEDAKKLESIILDEIDKSLERQDQEIKRAEETKKLLQDRLIASFAPDTLPSKSEH